MTKGNSRCGWEWTPRKEDIRKFPIAAVRILTGKGKMRTCSDGRIWGQNNKEARNHLGVLALGTKYSRSYIKKGYNQKSANKKGEDFSYLIRFGAKNGNWKGGITPKQCLIRTSIEYRLWREAVFARDNWTCQKCGQQGGTLNAHHIHPFSRFPELRFAIDNGLTLCRKCHIKIGRNKTKGG